MSIPHPSHLSTEPNYVHRVSELIPHLLVVDVLLRVLEHPGPIRGPQDSATSDHVSSPAQVSRKSVCSLFYQIIKLHLPISTCNIQVKTESVLAFESHMAYKRNTINKYNIYVHIYVCVYIYMCGGLGK